MRKHWTETNVENFLSRIRFDFIAQLEKRMNALSLSQAELAKRLNVTEGHVSQILNNRSNMELKTIVRFARALGLKVSVVAYDDGDYSNMRGPVNSEIFSICWERYSKPLDFFELEENSNKVIGAGQFVGTSAVLSDNNYTATPSKMNILPSFNSFVRSPKSWKVNRATAALRLVSENTQEIASAA